MICSCSGSCLLCVCVSRWFNPLMSYRALKHLLGETSLERKCRFLFGAFILLLITGSFWLYLYLTEHLAYAQATTTCRLLVNPLLAMEHMRYYQGKKDKEFDLQQLER